LITLNPFKILSKGLIFIILLFFCTTTFGQIKNSNNQYENPDKNLHSPKKAAMYSTILPGLGQAYNKKYWKIPIIYFGAGVLYYAIQFNNDHYFQFKNAFLDFTDDDPETRSYLDVTSLDVESFDESQRKFFMEELIDFKDYYRKYRDLSIIGLIGLYLVNIIDASVDAHLLDFDISDDLSFNIKPYAPSLISPSNFAGLKFSFYF